MTTVQLTGSDIQKFLDVASQFNLQVTIIDNIKMPNLSKRKKGKWAKVADEVRGTMSESTSDYLQECSNEVRNGFALRDLSVSK